MRSTHMGYMLLEGGSLSEAKSEGSSAASLEIGVMVKNAALFFTYKLAYSIIHIDFCVYIGSA